MNRYLQRALVALAALAALVAVVGAGAGTTRGPRARAFAGRRRRRVTARRTRSKPARLLSFELCEPAGRIRSRGLPAGVSVGRVGGHASVTWTPTAAQVGEHMLTFVAQHGQLAMRGRGASSSTSSRTRRRARTSAFPLGGIERHVPLGGDLLGRLRAHAAERPREVDRAPAASTRPRGRRTSSRR